MYDFDEITGAVIRVKLFRIVKFNRLAAVLSLTLRSYNHLYDSLVLDVY